MAQNLLGKIFNKQPAAVQETSVDSSTLAKSSDGLTGVAKYLQDKQPPPQQTATAPAPKKSAAQAVEQAPTSVAKYVKNIKPATLTGVAKYLVKQIIPEYQIKSAAAAKAAAPSGVEKYLAKVTAAAATQQPAVPSSVEKYLKKIG
jgi:hypothetical protein